MREKKVSDEVMSPKALFAIACVILAVSMVSFALSMVWVQDMFAPAPETGEPSEPGLPGGEIIGMMLVMFANIVMVTLIMLFHAFLWGGGMLVSARLAFSRQEKPALKRDSNLKRHTFRLHMNTETPTEYPPQPKTKAVCLGL